MNNGMRIRMLRLLYFFSFCCVLYLIAITVNIQNDERGTCSQNYKKREDFEGFNNETGTSNGCYIIPNIVHFLRFNQPELSFVDMVCILAAYKNQKPDFIFIHTDMSHLHGKYWEYILKIDQLRDIIQLKQIEIPKHIFGQEFNFEQYGYWHAGDVIRLKILMKYGGIFLDNDSFIVKNLNEFRKYEMTLGWKLGESLASQVIISHQNARFLHLWVESYRNHYDKKLWYYNAGIRPTQEILIKKPYLIHRMVKYIADRERIYKLLYLERNNDWMHHYAFHLYINHQSLIGRNLTEKATYPVIFDEINIKNYPNNFHDMVASVYPLE